MNIYCNCLSCRERGLQTCATPTAQRNVRGYSHKTSLQQRKWGQRKWNCTKLWCGSIKHGRLHNQITQHPISDTADPWGNSVQSQQRGSKCIDQYHAMMPPISIHSQSTSSPDEDQHILLPPILFNCTEVVANTKALLLWPLCTSSVEGKIIQ